MRTFPNPGVVSPDCLRLLIRPAPVLTPPPPLVGAVGSTSCRAGAPYDCLGGAPAITHGSFLDCTVKFSRIDRLAIIHTPAVSLPRPRYPHPAHRDPMSAAAAAAFLPVALSRRGLAAAALHRGTRKNTVAA